MSLLVTPWNPAEVYGILQRNREQRMREQQAAQSLAASIAANFAKQQNFREKLDFDREQAARTEAYRDRYLDVLAGKNALNQQPAAPLAIPMEPSEPLPASQPSESPERSMPELPAKTEIPIIPGTQSSDPRVNFLRDIDRRNAAKQMQTTAPDGEVPLSEALQNVDATAVKPIAGKEPIEGKLPTEAKAPLPDELPTLGLPSNFVPAKKPDRTSALSALRFPLTPEAVQRVNLAAASGEKRKQEQLETELRQAAMQDTAKVKQELKVPPDAGSLFDDVDSAVAKADELKKQGYSVAPVMDFKTRKYGLKFYSKDQDEQTRRNAKLQFDVLSRSLTETDRRMAEAQKQLDKLKTSYPEVASTTGIFTTPDGKRRFGQQGVRAENSTEITPELDRAYSDWNTLTHELGALRDTAATLRTRRAVFDDIAGKGFDSSAFRGMAPGWEGKSSDAKASDTQKKVLDPDTAKALLKEAGGDKEKARALARQRGYNL